MEMPKPLRDKLEATLAVAAPNTSPHLPVAYRMGAEWMFKEMSKDLALAVEALRDIRGDLERICGPDKDKFGWMLAIDEVLDQLNKYSNKGQDE